MPGTLAERLAAVKNQSTCQIITRGRRTGKPHAKTIWFAVEDTVVYLATLNTGRDWVRNAQKNPDVELDLGAVRVRGRLATITDAALATHVGALLAGKYWMAWVGSWLGRGPERTFRVDEVKLAG